MSDESDSTIELNRRRVLGSLGVIGIASAGAGAGTMALFSDTETSSGNTVQAGTLNLTANTSQSFNTQANNIEPGETTNTVGVDLGNSGSIPGDHVELSVSYGESDGSEPSDTDLSQDISAQKFADRLFVTKLKYPVSSGNIGLPVEAFGTFTNHQNGAAVVDIGGDGLSDAWLERTSDPSGGSRMDVVHATSRGTSTNDYAISMRKVKSTSLGGISSGDITFDYYGGANNSVSAPDEVYVVVNDNNGDDRLFFHTGNDGSPAAQTWKTRDVGAELSGTGSPLNPSFVWKEIGGGSYARPSNGGLAADISGTIEAVGFGRGTTGGGDTLDVYYDNLNVNGDVYKFRPMSLDDIARRGTFDALAGIPDGGSKSFNAQFKLDRLAGNDFQGDGVSMDFEFGLAQEANQDVL